MFIDFWIYKVLRSSGAQHMGSTYASPGHRAQPVRQTLNSGEVYKHLAHPEPGHRLRL
jgi:hypothetical protein